MIRLGEIKVRKKGRIEAKEKFKENSTLIVRVSPGSSVLSADESVKIVSYPLVHIVRARVITYMECSLFTTVCQIRCRHLLLFYITVVHVVRVV